MVEDYFEKDSLEAGNAYFMMGIYYYEQKQLAKSLACFIKTHFIRVKELGEISLGTADCLINMATIYKRIGFWTKAIDHFQKAIAIRKELVGPFSLGVADVQEKLGKLYIEISDYSEALTTLKDAFLIRKRLLSTSEFSKVAAD
jgi:tetratricopeptide (TPR) repeat protein